MVALQRLRFALLGRAEAYILRLGFNTLPDCLRVGSAFGTAIIVRVVSQL
jgi:hypothetical protein